MNIEDIIKRLEYCIATDCDNYCNPSDNCENNLLIEALNCIKELLPLKELNTPKKPIDIDGKKGFGLAMICPNCHTGVFDDYGHCIECGQLLKWEEKDYECNDG